MEILETILPDFYFKLSAEVSFSVIFSSMVSTAFLKMPSLTGF